MKLIFHIGAHKTATTHIQDTFEFHSEDLKNKNIRYIPRKTLRSKDYRFTSCISRFDRFIFFRKKTVGKRMQAIFEKLTKPDDACVLLSEENLIGTSRDILLPKIYPDLETNLRAIRTLVHNNDYIIFIAIRNFKDIIPSAYSQMVREGKIQKGFLDDVSRSILINGRTWKDFITRLFSVIPEDRVRIYRYEDYFYHSQEILSSIAGLNSNEIKFKKILAPASTKSLSAETLVEIENGVQWKTKAQQRKLVAELSRRDAGVKKFRPFSLETESLLDRNYDSDINWIKENYPHTLISFE